MALSSWQELSKRNIRKMQDIFETADVDYPDRLEYGKLAFALIREERFDSASGRWNAFLNALEMIVQGFNGVSRPKPKPRNLDDERDEGERTGN